MGQFIVNFKRKYDLIDSNQPSGNTQKKSANVIRKTKRQVKTV
jgi:hypothetical protein